MIAFKDLELKDNVNITEAAYRHSAQAGSIFTRRAECLQTLELAKDNVKYVLAKIEMETHPLGKIPDGLGGPGIKITGASMKAYIDSHPDVKKAREGRAQAEHDYDLIKGIVTAYNANKELLQMIGKDRNQEFYSAPKEDNGLQDLIKD